MPDEGAARAAMTAATKDAEGRWTPLFNGRDLAGWSVKCVAADTNKVYWRVADGAIVVDSTQNPKHDYVWLMADGEYGDFLLRLRFQPFRGIPGNSGVPFRYADDPEPWNDLRILARNARVIVELNGRIVRDADLKGVLDDAPHRERNTGLRIAVWPCGGGGGGSRFILPPHRGKPGGTGTAGRARWDRYRNSPVGAEPRSGT
ncbi:MAG: hypothetical protein BWK77_01690 [Verrucomicrobia bacterium A1]|nr:MAG: hypothetical protein BWK77_01690 [Verrucomicrobia bacterium A1]